MVNVCVLLIDTTNSICGLPIDLIPLSHHVQMNERLKRSAYWNQKLIINQCFLEKKEIKKTRPRPAEFFKEFD
jgi:hypothetical protein